MKIVTFIVFYLFFIQGTVLKKYSLQEEECYKELMQDNLMRAVPRFFQTVEIDGESKKGFNLIFKLNFSYP